MCNTNLASRTTSDTLRLGLQGGEEAENATAASSSPLEEKSEASSPSDEQAAAPIAASADEAKEETAAASPAAASPLEEKKEEPTPSAPTPVPSVEDKKEEAVEKVEAEKKVVEVSQSTGGQSVTDPVEVPVYRVQPVATPSIIERKTSEELPSLFPSSPPPTPIDPSPLQQARQAAASATALAEALKLPAEAVDEEESTLAPVVAATSPSSCEDVPRENRAESITTPAIASPILSGPSADSPPTIVPAKVECLPVVEAKIEFQDVKKTGEILASSCDNDGKKEEAGIALKVESTSESPVIMEEVSECREAPVVMESDTEEQLNGSIDNENRAQSIGVMESEVEYPKEIPKEIDPFANSDKDSSEGNSPATNLIEDVDPMAENETTVLVVEMDEVMNQTLPVVECQIKNEINSCADAVKINASSGGRFNENLETEASAEIETKDVCSAEQATQHLSPESFETEKMDGTPDETTPQYVEILSDSVEKCVMEELLENLSSAENSSKNLEQEAESTEQLCEKLIEYDYVQDGSIESKDERLESVNSPTELFINSEEGPLSVSEGIVVEAMPAMIIPEDDSVEELTDTTESIKVILETDKERIEHELESDTALPTEETLISEELEDMSVPEESSNEPAVSSIVKDEAKIVGVEDTLPSPPPEDLIAFDSQSELSEFQSTISMSEPVEEESVTASASLVEAETIMMSTEQTEQIERCFLSSEDHTTPNSYPLDPEATPEASRLSGVPLCILPKRPNKAKVQVLSPGLENVPISLEDLPPAPEDAGSQTLDSFDYPLPPEDLSCPSPSIVLANASVIESSQPSLPASVEHAACPRDPTETLLTPPVSPSSHNSSVNTVSDVATNELTMTNSCDRSDVESKGNLAECPAKAESEDGALSCELSNNIPLTAAKEHHQVTNMQTTTSWHERGRPKFFGGRLVPRITSSYGSHNTVSVVL